jgi:DNA repair photolyase
MEPRVPAASSRLNALRELSQAGIPVSLLLAPIIPAINDAEIEAILEAAAGAGVGRAHYVFLRLPHEVKDVFGEWLEAHFQDRREHVNEFGQASKR